MQIVRFWQLPVLHLQVKEHLVGDEAGEAGLQETEPLAHLVYCLYVLVVELPARRGLIPAVEQFVDPVQDGEHFRQATERLRVSSMSALTAVLHLTSPFRLVVAVLCW